MQTEILNSDCFQICDLEYDAAGIGSTESTTSEVNLAAFIFYFYFSIPFPGA